MAYKNKADATAYQNSYISKTYDRINLTVPKGYKEAIRARAESLGLSVNAYIKALIDEDMKKIPPEP